MGHRRRLILHVLIVFLATTHAADHGQATAAITRQQQEQGTGGVRSMVGSRPPSCAGRCWWCSGRRCEAVQVPVTPKEEDLISKRGGHHHGGGAAAQGRRGGGGGSSSRHSLHPSSYDDRSNYKPLSWRCICGHP